MNRPPRGEDLKRLHSHMHLLKVSAQDVPNMTVKIMEGNFWANGTILVEYAGGNSPLIVKPAIGKKYVCVVINKYGAISIVDGPISTTTLEPALPSVSKDLLPLALMYIKSDTLIITNDMIYDIRPIFNLGTFKIIHAETEQRDAANAHPISSIIDLQDELDARPVITDMVSALASKADMDGTTSKIFKLSKDESGVANEDIILEFFRGAEGFAAIKFSESNNRIEFTNDGVNFYPLTNTGEYYTKLEMDALLDAKANAIDVYIKDEVDMMLDTKANALDVYNKTEVDNKFTDLIGGAPGILDTLKEIDDALNNDANLATNLSNEIATKVNILDVNSALALKADLTLVNDMGVVINNLSNTINDVGAAVNTETSTRESVDTVLNNNINGVGMVVNNLNDTINGVGAAVNNLTGTVNDIGAAVNTEVITRESIDTILTNNLSTEVNTRESVDTILIDNLSTETSIRESSDTILTSNISTEVSNRESVDNTLIGNISTEVSNRISGDTILTGNLSTEASIRESADTILSTELSLKADKTEIFNPQVSNIIYVDKNRVDVYVENGTVLKPFKTIQAAIDTVVSSGVQVEIRLSPADYTENFIMNKTQVALAGTRGVKLLGDITISAAVTRFIGITIKGNVTANLTGNSKIDLNDCDTGIGTWNVTATENTGAAYFQVWGGIFYAPTTITGFFNGLIAINASMVQTSTININGSWLQISGTAFNSGTMNLNNSTCYIGASTTDGAYNLNVDATTTLTADADFIGSVTLTNLGTLTLTTKANNIVYTPTLASDWAGTTPTTTQEALDRMSALLKSLNGGNAIP